jgi:hypothetical protein
MVKTIKLPYHKTYGVKKIGYEFFYFDISLIDFPTEKPLNLAEFKGFVLKLLPGLDVM